MKDRCNEARENRCDEERSNIVAEFLRFKQLLGVKKQSFLGILSDYFYRIIRLSVKISTRDFRKLLKHPLITQCYVFYRSR